MSAHGNGLPHGSNAVRSMRLIADHVSGLMDKENFIRFADVRGAEIRHGDTRIAIGLVVYGILIWQVRRNGLCRVVRHTAFQMLCESIMRAFKICANLLMIIAIVEHDQSQSKGNFDSII